MCRLGNLEFEAEDDVVDFLLSAGMGCGAFMHRYYGWMSEAPKTKEEEEAALTRIEKYGITRKQGERWIPDLKSRNR